MQEEETNFLDALSDLPASAVCCKCGQVAQHLFFLDGKPHCTECCDALEVEEILHYVGAQSVCDLLCDFGFAPAQSN